MKLRKFYALLLFLLLRLLKKKDIPLTTTHVILYLPLTLPSSYFILSYLTLQ